MRRVRKAYVLVAIHAVVTLSLYVSAWIGSSGLLIQGLLIANLFLMPLMPFIVAFVANRENTNARTPRLLSVMCSLTAVYAFWPKIMN